MSRKFPLFPVWCVLATLCAGSFADTVVLTTGEKVEGKILSETAAEVTVEVKVSAGVLDQQVIPRAKVAKIEKTQPDEAAWEGLKNLRLGQNSLPADQYDSYLRPLQGFINEFPQSAHVAAATGLLTAFAEEKRRVDGGEVRIGEKWLSREEVEKEGYQIHAQLAYQAMRSARQAGDVIAALNTFDAIEKNYPGAAAYPDAVDAARESLAALKMAVDRAQQGYKAMQTEFEQGVAAASIAERAELIAARKRELARGEAALAAAEKAHLKWAALVPRSDKNIAALAQKVPPEAARLTALDVAKMRQSLALSTEARQKIESKNPEADDLLRKAGALWPANEAVKRLQPEATALKNLAKATPIPEEAPKTTPAATPVHRVSTPVAAAPQPEPAKPFLLSPGGLILILLLVAGAIGGGIAYKRFKDRSDEGLE